MKVLLTGPTGQAGRALLETAPSWVELQAVDHAQMDITAADDVHRLVASLQPDVILNAAAYTDVDGAETNAELAHAINATGAENLASAARECDGRMVQLSTDYVFRGELSHPIAPDDPTGPLNQYGETKLAGEQLVARQLGSSALIIRTSWLYFRNGRNFAHTMLRLMAGGDAVHVVYDQIGSPSWAGSLADAIWQAVGNRLTGTYHWRDAGVASWYDFATAIAEISHEIGLLPHRATVVPIRTDEFPTVAQRPAYSVLDTSTLEEAISMRPRHWRDNLRQMLEQLQNA